jgi:hypothetical protein
MNDFTKQELYMMLLALSYYGFISEEQADLILKLKYIIDNYCEHKKIEFVGDVYGFECSQCREDITPKYIGEDRINRIINCEE